MRSMQANKHGDQAHSYPMFCNEIPRIFLTAPPSYDAVAIYLGPCENRLRDGKLPSNFPRSERCRGLSAASVFNVDELVTKHPSFPLQIGQHPVTVLLFIGLLSGIHIGSAIAQHAID